MRYWMVHYPDGTIRKHGCADKDHLPDLEKVFYINGKFNVERNHFQIVEMNEEEIWVEAISKVKYDELIHITDNTMDNFVYFYMKSYPIVYDFSGQECCA